MNAGKTETALPQRSFPRRLLRGTARWVLRGVAALLVLALALAAAVLLVLRTNWAEQKLASLAVDALAGQGYYLELASLEGPLPRRLLLKGVRLSDRDGPLLTADEAELEIALLALVKRELRFETVALTKPELLRLPAAGAAPGAGEGEDAPPPAGRSPFPDLPFSVYLDGLAIVDALLPWSIAGLGPESIPPDVPPDIWAGNPSPVPETHTDHAGDMRLLLETALDRPLLLNAKGRAELVSGVLTAELSLEALAGDISLALAAGPVRFVLRDEEDPARAMRGEAAANLSLGFPLDGRDEETSLALGAELDGPQLTVSTLALRGLGVTLEGDAAWNLDEGNINAALSLRALNDAPWLRLLLALAGRDAARAEGIIRAAGEGSITLALEAGRADGVLSLSSLSLDGMGLTVNGSGGVVEADGSLRAAVTGKSGAGAPWQILAHEMTGMDTALLSALADPLSLDVSAERDAAGVFSLDIAGLRAGQVSAEGSLRADTGAAFGPATDLAARLSIRVAELAPFGAGVSGPLAAEVDARGTPRSATGSVALTSARLTTDAGALDNLALTVDGNFAMHDDGSMGGEGTLATRTDSGPAGAARADGGWKFFLPGNGGGALEAAVRGLDLEVFGLSLAGDMAASVPMPFPDMAAAVRSGVYWPAGLALNGELLARVNEWHPLSALTGMELSGGTAELSLDLRHEGAVQNAAARLDMPSVRLAEDVAVNEVKAVLDAALGASRPDLHLSLDMGSGGAASLAWSGARARVQSNGPSGDFSVAVASATPVAPGRDPGRDPGLSPGDLLAVRGKYDLETMLVTLDGLGLKEPESGTAIALAKPVRIDLSRGIEARDVTLEVTGGGGLVADLSMLPGRMEMKARLADLPLALINRLAGTTLPPGDVNAELSFHSGPGLPEASLLAELRLDDAAPAPGPGTPFPSPGGSSGASPDVSSNTSLGTSLGTSPDASPAALRLEAALARSSGGLRLTGGVRSAYLAASGAESGATDENRAPITFSIPMQAEAGGFPSPRMNGPLEASLRWKGSVAPLWRFAPMPDRDLTGVALVDIGVGGTLAAPTVKGAAYLAEGRFDDKALGVLLTDIMLEARAASLEEFHIVLSASDGDQGSVGLEGSLNLAREEALALRGQIRHLSPVHRDDLNIVVSGLFSANGSLAAPTVGAHVLVEHGEVTLLSSLLGSSSVPTLEISDAGADVKDGGAGPVLDVRVEVPRRFYIRGRGLDSEWQGNLRITGAASEPELRGSLSPVRGTFDLLSRTFQFTSGEIEFAGGSRINPAINLELTYYGADITGIVRAGGTAGKPSLTLDSVPPLPQDEVLAQVLFGKSVSDLSRFEMIQLANGLRELSGIGEGGLDPLTTMRKATGLDVLRLGSTGDDQQARSSSGLSGDGNLTGQSAGGTGTEGGASVEAGKYLSDSIYIGVEQGLTQEETAVRVEIELYPNVTLQGRSSTESSQAGVGWKMDY